MRCPPSDLPQPDTEQRVVRAITDFIRIAYSLAPTAHNLRVSIIECIVRTGLRPKQSPRSHHHRAKLLGHSSQIQQEAQEQGGRKWTWREAGAESHRLLSRCVIG